MTEPRRIAHLDILRGLYARLLAQWGYVHTEPAPTTTWVVDHNLGYQPAGLDLYDAADGRRCEGYAVAHPTVNRLVLTLDVPIAGTLYLS